MVYHGVCDVCCRSERRSKVLSGLTFVHGYLSLLSDAYSSGWPDNPPLPPKRMMTRHGLGGLSHGCRSHDNADLSLPPIYMSRYLDR